VGELEYCVSLNARPWLSVLYEEGRMGILKSCSVLDDRSRDSRRSQDIISEKNVLHTTESARPVLCRLWVVFVWLGVGWCLE